MEHDQYPKTYTNATDILSNHRFDNRMNSNKKKWSQSKKNEDENTSTQKTDETKETSFAQGGKDKTCYCCGKKGHMIPECPQKNSIKKEDWAISEATVDVQAEKEDEDQDDDSTSDGVTTNSKSLSKLGWSNLLVEVGNNFYTGDQNTMKRMRNSITLDNGSTLSIFQP
jgi:hypothetical protein